MKIHAYLFLVLSLIVVSGAAGCPSNEKEAASAGLSTSFSQNAPPLSVSVGQEFPIYIEVINEGGDFVNPGTAKFYLSGIGPNLEGVLSSVVNERTLSKESVSPDRIVFAEKAKFTFPIERFHTLPLVLTSCYSYGTRTEASICVSATNITEVCEVGVEKIDESSNSVSPVKISSLKEEVVGNRLRVMFDITNSLSGEVYHPSTDCDKLLLNRDVSESFKQDKVSIEVRTPEVGFSCKLQSDDSPYTPLDSLTGTASVGRVVCEKTLGGRENYATPFRVILRYKYVDSSSKSINILP